MRYCPHCQKEIPPESLWCSFCGKALAPQGYAPSMVTRPESPKWYLKTSTLIVGFLVIGPFILPLVWMNPRYSAVKKIVFTAVILGISFILMRALAGSLNAIRQYYDVIGVF